MKKFPLVYRYDSKDCGPNCIQMGLRYHGGDAAITRIRQTCDLDLNGVSMAAMERAALPLGFEALATHVNASALEICHALSLFIGFRIISSW
nr:cysteine peptidase family C39 domain-containing protein [Pseudovibrio sp. Tun.PSC04-5.I4]